MKIAFVSLWIENLGLEYISAVLKSAGHQTRLFVDPKFLDSGIIRLKPLRYFLDYSRRIISGLKAYKPDLIGISVVTDFYQWALTMARMIKKEIDVPIIFGGIHPTSVPERVIANDAVDMVCVGEGEYPMLELVNSLEKGSIDYSIKNIWFKKDGRLIQNEIRPLIEDLDSLPMPDTDLYYSASPHFKKSGLYLTLCNRGCAYSCSYCCYSYLHELYKSKGRRVRQRSVSKVIQELLAAKKKYDMKFVAFMDNCFGYDVHWLKDFAREYKSKIGIEFWCIVHPSHVSAEAVRYLKEAGCNTMDMGIQSWSKEIRSTVLNRHVENEVMERAMRLIKEAGIRLMADSIFDLPGQTEKDVINCAVQYAEAQPGRIFFYMLRHYPQTAITKQDRASNRISPQRYEEIIDGINVTNSATGGEGLNGKMIQFQILFYLIDLVPKSVGLYIIKKRLFRFFPTIFGPAVIVILRNLLAFDINARLLRRGAICRYLHFSLQSYVYNIKKRK